MPKSKMKPSTPAGVQHFVIIDVDGVVEEVLVADESAGQALAERVLVAAEQLLAVRVPLGRMGNGEVVVGGEVVLDLAKARRTEVTVFARSMAMASMGLKK
jgi:hypothetical protein